MIAVNMHSAGCKLEVRIHPGAPAMDVPPYMRLTMFAREGHPSEDYCLFATSDQLHSIAQTIAEFLGVGILPEGAGHGS